MDAQEQWSQNLISSTTYAPLVPGPRSLSRSIDDVERDFGYQVYDGMLTEPYVAASVRTLVFHVLSEPLLISPGVEEPEFLEEEPTDRKRRDRRNKGLRESDAVQQYARAVEYAAFQTHNMQQLERRSKRGTQALLADLLLAATHGHRLAEITEIRAGADEELAGKLVFRSVRPIPHGHYRFVVDPYMELLGVLSIQPHKGALWTGMLGSISQDNFVEREKLLVLTHDMRDDNPNGRSLLRAAYDPWWRKRAQKPVEIKRLAQFGGESMLIEAPPNVGNEKRLWVLPNGSVEEMHVSQMLLTYGQELGSGRIAVVPNGTKPHILGATSGADLFESHADRCNREIVMSVLLSARATMESTRNSQADGEKAENLLDNVKRFYSEWITQAIQEQLVRPSMRRNFGNDAADRLCPMATLSKANFGDFNRVAQGIATLANAGVISQAMLPVVCRTLLGLRYVPGQPVNAREAKPPKGADPNVNSKNQEDTDDAD